MPSGIFQRLMIARQLKFAEGSIELFGNRSILFPTDYLGKFIYDIKDNTKYTTNLYLSIKKDSTEFPIFSIPKTQEISPIELTKRIADVINFEGWGIISFGTNIGTPAGNIEMENSAFAECLKGKIAFPCDHLLRGILAGTLSAIHKRDIDVVETQCRAVSGNKCIFVYDKLEKLMTNYPDLVTKQIGLSGKKAT